MFAFEISKKNNIMKKTFLLVLLILPLALFAQSQKIYLDTANVFHTYLESGIGEQIPISFNIENIDTIKLCKVYIEWEKETFANPANAKYVADHKSMQHIEMFLMSKIEAESSVAKQSMKNSISYSPIKGSIGRVMSIKSDTIEYVFIDIPIQAQNGYGNTVMKEWRGSIEWNKLENKEEIRGMAYDQ